MQIKTCQAENLKALMDKMRKLYGPQAVLLSVRRLADDDRRTSAYNVIEGTVATETPAVAPEQPTVASKPQIQAPPLAARPHPAPRESAAQNVPSDFSHTAPSAPCESLATLQAVALVGPMGAGKTTTAAKIAGRLAQMRNQPVGVISTDTDRPGGSALLAAYAQELQLSMTTATAASDLQNRLSRWNCRGPLVIDTRGYSPRDGIAIERLGELLSTNTMKMQRYLVLSATEHPAVARECLDAYAAIGLHGVVLTRVDQAAGIGHCLAEVRKSNVPIAFIGTGERVPMDLREPSSTSLLALENSARNVFA